ncbi:MAG: cell envelope biogenesis protein LolA [Hyphomicrobiaceae bacterium]|nr:MAG: cell envelope biogenesis protein LolA [Hyphomicrobiaceae bacterium]
MKACMAAPFALIAALGLLSGAAFAQDAKKTPPTNPVGGGATWTQTVNRDAAVTGEEFDKKQIALIQKVNGYFNQMSDMKGVFVQTSADSKRIRGKFFVKRPGRFRFDYAPPSKLVILSDGEYLAIQDHDLKTDDRFALDQTPFRVLLRKDVDLLRDARVLEVQEIDDVIVVALQDKSPDAPGRIKVFLAKKPNLELKEWITTDSQGLETRIELSDLTKADDLDPALFKPAPLALQKLQ